jgi:hypothetical protein
MRPSVVFHPHQLEALVPAGHVDLQDDPQTRCVELRRDDSRLQAGSLERPHHATKAPERDLESQVALDDPRLIFGVTRVELLPVSVGRLRVGRHDDARDGAVDAGTPRPLRALEVALRIEGGRALSQVPHVPFVVAAYQSIVLSRI